MHFMSAARSIQRRIPVARMSIRRQARHVIAVTAAIWGLSERAVQCEVPAAGSLSSSLRPRLFGLNQPA